MEYERHPNPKAGHESNPFKMCIKCNFMIAPFPPHSPAECPLLLKCAYCSTCGVYNAHFPTQCPKRARGTLPSKFLPKPIEEPMSESTPPQPDHVFRLPSHKDIKPPTDTESEDYPKLQEAYQQKLKDCELVYKEYFKTHNLVTPHAASLDTLREAIKRDMKTHRRITLKTPSENLSAPFVPAPNPVKMKRTKNPNHQ